MLSGLPVAKYTRRLFRQGITGPQAARKRAHIMPAPHLLEKGGTYPDEFLPACLIKQLDSSVHILLAVAVRDVDRVHCSAVALKNHGGGHVTVVPSRNK